MAAVDPARARNPWIECLRLIAICGVIAFHARVPILATWAYAGLVAFVILSPYVDARYNERRQRSMPALARSFLIPWLFWMVVYGALKLATGNALFRATGT